MRARTPRENSEPNLLHSSPCPPAQATRHPILPLRRHKEPHELLTWWSCREDAILRLRGTWVLLPWGFAGQRHRSKRSRERTDRQICTEVR